MRTFDDYLENRLKDPQFRAEYERLESDRAIVQALLDARTKAGLTQKQLSEKAGIAQGDISKLESGEGNPSIKTLQRLASAMGTVLKVEFVGADYEPAN